jgi:hypothetical protein
MSRSTHLEHTARGAGRSKPAWVSGLDEKRSDALISKEESNSLLILKNTLHNRRCYSIERLPFREPDLSRVFGVAV